MRSNSAGNAARYKQASLRRFIQLLDAPLKSFFVRRLGAITQYAVVDTRDSMLRVLLRSVKGSLGSSPTALAFQRRGRYTPWGLRVRLPQLGSERSRFFLARQPSIWDCAHSQVRNGAVRVWPRNLKLFVARLGARSIIVCFFRIYCWMLDV